MKQEPPLLKYRERAIGAVMFQHRPHVLLARYPEAKAVRIRWPGEPDSEMVVAESETTPYELHKAWDSVAAWEQSMSGE